VGEFKAVIRHPRRQRPEQALQRALIEHLRVRGADGVVYLHPANGGARSAIEGAILKGMGVVPGAPDLLMWHQGRSYALELKAEAGRVSESQADMLGRLGKAGVLTAVCHGIDPALATLEGWQLLRGKAQTRLDDNANNLAASALPR
jgi:VRR-NUC domain